VGAIIIIASVFGSIYYHELNHRLLYAKIGATTILDEKGLRAISPANYKDLTNFDLANSFNESIEYNLMPLLLGIMGLLFLILLALIIFLKEKKDKK
jgi:hypothetical protein